MKNTGFCYAKEAFTCYHQIDTSLSAKMNGKQKRTLVWNALYILWYVKRHLLGLDDAQLQKIKPIALAIIKLRLSEGISQSVTQSVDTQKVPYQLFESILGLS